VDDPHKAGEIAAASALSRVWASGAKPVFALSLMGAPRDMSRAAVSKVLKGGKSKAEEAGISILGGSTFESAEPRFGLVVTGVVEPKKALGLAGARPGDVLILCKPIGSGIAAAALEQGKAPPALAKRVVGLMAALNKSAGEVLAKPGLGVHALTCVADRGLLGGLWEMASASKVRANLFLPFVPVIEGVPLLSDEVVGEATPSNLEWIAKKAHFPDQFPEPIKRVLVDAQVNGGLLAAVPERTAQKTLDALAKAGVGAAAIGEVAAGRPGVEVLV
jgi:selenide,water dikinase